MSDSSCLLNIASAGRVNIPCDAFPRRTEVMSEDGTGMQRVSLYPDPVPGQHKLGVRRSYWESCGWGLSWFPAGVYP